MSELTRVGDLIPIKEQPELAFNAKPFVLCGLPVRQPAGHIHERRNGDYTLRVVAGSKHGLPFGQDRIVLIWISTLAVQQKERMLAENSLTVHFDSMSQLLEMFGLPDDGPHHKRVSDAFKRVHFSSIYFGTAGSFEDAKVYDNTHFTFFEKVKMRRKGFEERSEVTISKLFWEELQAHPIPVNMAVVRKLVNFPAQMDFYIWLVWRCWGLRTPVKIPLVGEHGLLGQMGVSEHTETREFRRQLREWLDNIRQPE